MYRQQGQFLYICNCLLIVRRDNSICYNVCDYYRDDEMVETTSFTPITATEAVQPARYFIHHKLFTIIVLGSLLIMPYFVVIQVKLLHLYIHQKCMMEATTGK